MVAWGLQGDPWDVVEGEARRAAAELVCMRKKYLWVSKPPFHTVNHRSHTGVSWSLEHLVGRAKLCFTWVETDKLLPETPCPTSGYARLRPL